MLTVQYPTVTPTFALQETILVLAGVVVGGHDAPPLRDARRLLHRLRVGAPRRRAAVEPEPVPAVARLRPRHPRPARSVRTGCSRAAAASWSGCESASRSGRAPRGRALLVVAAGIVGALVSQTNRDLLHHRAHLGRRRSSRSTSSSATRACSRSATSASSPSASGPPACSRSPRRRSRRRCRTSSTSSARHTVGNVPSLLIAAAVGGVFALLVGLPLMRLSGLAAGIATFAVLGITNNILRYYEKIGPGPEHVLVRAGDDRSRCRRRSGPCSSSSPRSPTSEAGSGGSFARRARIPRRLARSASRSTGSGSRRSRSPGSSPGFAGGLYIHFIPINIDAVYLDLTFITLAMLVIGGTTSLWGAVVGALVRERARLGARGDGGRHDAVRAHDRPAVGLAHRRRQRGHGARPDRAAERAHRRPRVLASEARGPSGRPK